MLPAGARALRSLLLASILVGADAAGAPAGEGDRARPATGGTPSKPSPGDTGRRREAGKKDPDQELLDHLDEIERLELLQNLELFDTAAKRK